MFTVLLSLAMNDPPFQFKLSGLPRIKRDICGLSNRLIKAFDLRERFFVITSRVPALERKRRTRRFKGNDVRTRGTGAILFPQRSSCLIEEAQLVVRIIRAPHLSLESSDFLRVESAQVTVIRSKKVISEPDETHEKS